MEAGANNPFVPLPDDVIHVIFDKIRDLRTLIRCSVVCNRFAFLTSQMDTIRLPISLTRPNDATRWPCISTLKKRFPYVKNLKLEVFGDFHYPLVAKWKALYGYETHIDTCLILFSDYSQLAFKPGFNAKDPFLPIVSQFCFQSILQKVRYYLSHRISDLELLRSVSFSNSQFYGYGKLFISEEEILKQKKSNTMIQSKSPPMRVMLWHVPVLNLPKLDIQVQNTVLFVVCPADQPIDMEKFVKLVMNNDAEDDQVFDESVREMLKNENKMEYEFEFPSLSF